MSPLTLYSSKPCMIIELLDYTIPTRWHPTCPTIDPVSIVFKDQILIPNFKQNNGNCYLYSVHSSGSSLNTNNQNNNTIVPENLVLYLFKVQLTSEQITMLREAYHPVPPQVNLIWHIFS